MSLSSASVPYSEVKTKMWTDKNVSVVREGTVPLNEEEGRVSCAKRHDLVKLNNMLRWITPTLLPVGVSD